MSDTAAEPVDKAAGRESPHALAVRTLAAAMLRATVIGTVVVGFLAAIVCAVLIGLPGLLGSLVGSAIALASALVTILMMRKTAALPPAFVMVVALGGYALKVMVLFGVLVVLRGVTVLHAKSLGITMLVAIMVVALAELRAFRRTKLPTLIIESN